MIDMGPIAHITMFVLSAPAIFVADSCGSLRRPYEITLGAPDAFGRCDKLLYEWIPASTADGW